MADLNLTQGTVSDGGGTRTAIDPTKANDGNADTYTYREPFAALAGVYTVMWKTDLGTAEAVSQMVLRESQLVGHDLHLPTLAAVPGSASGAYSEGAAYAWSDDGSAWTDFTASITETRSLNNGQDVATLDFAELTHRYWRVTFWSQCGSITYHHDMGFAVWEIPETAGATPTPAENPGLYFDVYAKDDPNGDLLVTLDGAQQKAIRPAKNSPGSGSFVINKNHPQATATNLTKGNIVKVRFQDLGVTDYIFAFILEQGDFTLVSSDEEGGELLSFSGPGVLAYLDRAQMDTESHIDTPFNGTNPQGNRRWPLHLAGTGAKPGQIARRVLAELMAATTDTRTVFPVPDLTIPFDYTNDSSSDAWDAWDGSTEFEALAGDKVWSGVLARLAEAGVIVFDMEPDLTIQAYNPDNFGTDRTSTTFATGKVRFVKGVNIRDDLQRRIEDRNAPTHMVVMGDGSAFARAALAGGSYDYVREGSMTVLGTDTTALAARGAAELARLQTEGISLRLRIVVGDDEANGLYIPGPAASGGHFWYGDTVTLHTGTGDHEFNNASFEVAALTIAETETSTNTGTPRQGARPYEVIVELNSAFIGGSPTERAVIQGTAGTGGPSGGTGAHNHAAPIAAGVLYDNDDSGLTAENVQDAIDEIEAHEHALDDLSDVSAVAPDDGDFLAYDDYTGLWLPVAPPSGSVPDGTDPGDLLVWDGDSWAVLPIGTDDHRLTADSGEALGVKWAAGGGGGGSGGGRGEDADKYNPDHETPATTPDLAAEFNGSTDSFVFDSAPTTDDTATYPGHRYIVFAGGGGEIWLSRAWSPAGDLTIAMKCVLGPTTTANTTGIDLALALTNGTTRSATDGVFLFVFYDESTAPTLQMATRTSGSFALLGSAVGLRGGGALPMTIYLRLTRSGNTWTGYASEDGINWVQHTTTASKTFSPTHAVVRIADQAGTIVLDWIRGWTSVVTKVGG